MEKITMEKINNYYKKSVLAISAFAIFLLILGFKNFYFHLYDVKLENLTNIEVIIANTTYIIFDALITIVFMIKHKNDTLEKLKSYLKEVGIGLSTILVFSMTTVIELLIIYISKLNLANMSITALTIFLISCETLIMTVLALINYKKINNDLKNIKETLNKYLKKALEIYILSLVVMMISNLIINILTNGIAGNEESVRQIFNKAPVYMFFSAVLFAPFTEELVFRLSLKRIITNRKAFIIASGLIFGGLHVIGNINSIYDILYIIPYATPGIAFAIILDKTDNIFVPMGIHFLHNGLLMTLQAILLFI